MDGDTIKNEKESMKEKLLTIDQKMVYKYINDENVFLVLLAGDKRQKKKFELLDAIHKIVQTSIRFQHYSRAVKYMYLFSKLCDELFNTQEVSSMRENITKQMKR